MKRCLPALLLLLGGTLPAALAQPFAPPQPPPGYDLSDNDKDTVRVVAIQAAKQDPANAGMDDTLKPFRKILQSMTEFNTFRLISDATAQVTRGQESEIPLDARYAMHVVTGTGSDHQKRNLAARITLDGSVDALRAQGVAEPGKTIVFRGMDHPPGELVVLLQIVPPNDGNQNEGQRQKQQDQQQQNANENKQDQQPQHEGEEQNPQRQQEQQQAKPAEEEGEQEKAAAEPQKDAPNLEALLQSLEEIDRREQQNMLNANKRFPKIHGDWW